MSGDLPSVSELVGHLMEMSVSARQQVLDHLSENELGQLRKMMEQATVAFSPQLTALVDTCASRARPVTLTPATAAALADVAASLGLQTLDQLFASSARRPSLFSRLRPGRMAR